jgi:GT2 family glycosyltransferase
VVIPCYNYGHLLSGCIGSVLSQAGVDVRAHVIDDASPDGSGEHAELIARSDSRIRVTRHRTNSGHIATYNEGLAAAEADYVVLLSADDLLAPGSLHRATAVMEANPRVGFVYGYSRYFDDPARLPAPGRARARSRVESGPKWIERRLRSGTNVISSPEVVVRTRLQQEVGGYRADLPHSGDLEMWLRLAARGDVGIVAGVDQAYYRVHAASMSRTSFAKEFDELRQRYAAFDTFLSESGDVLADPERSRRRMGRALAAAALWRAARLQMSGAGDSTDAVSAMEEWALSVAPDAEGTPEFRALRRARRLGLRAPAHPTVLLTAARRRAARRRWATSRRWRCV